MSAVGTGQIEGGPTQENREVSGYASVTEKPYPVGEAFTEIIKRGAFRRSLGESPDVSLLLNHGRAGSSLPLARTTSGTLALSEDQTGLRFTAELDGRDPDVVALVPKIERRDVCECSFAFRATDQEWTHDKTERIVNAVALHRGDVSIVSGGANPHTSVNLRGTEITLDQRERRVADLGDRIVGTVPMECEVRGGVLTARPAPVMVPSSYVEEARLRRAQILGGTVDPLEHRDNPYSAAQMEQLGKEGKAIKNAKGEWSYPTKTRSDLLNAIHATGRTSLPKATLVAYLKRRARELGASRLIPNTWK